LARAARARLAPRARVFAITGSSGKTTARGMITAGLEASLARVHASLGSLNNHLGVPLSLARTPADADAAVFEIGTNSHGEIEPLSDLVRPHVSILLNVLPVHLEGLGDLAGVRREKLCIASGLDKEGLLVLHEAVAPPEALEFEILTFGRGPDADVRLLVGPSGEEDRIRLPGAFESAIQGTDQAGLQTTLHSTGSGTRSAPVEIATPKLAEGPHRRLTACAVLAAIHGAGLNVARAAPHVAGVAPDVGRGKITTHSGVRIIDDAYNANPESMRQALLEMTEHAGTRRVALLGDMLELGASSRSLHMGLADACASVDQVFAVGNEIRPLFDALPGHLRGNWWPDCEALDLDAVLAAAPAGSVILVKGSNRLFWLHDTVAALAQALTER